MKKILFHDGWVVKPRIAGPFDILAGQEAAGKPVILPHDAMIEEPRDSNSASGTQYGFYPAKSYTYTKKFLAPEAWADCQTLLEFEGVQQKAMVYLNGEFLAASDNGYTGFFADLTPYLRIGQENTLKVLAICEELASRWYPGAGIYRNVWLWQGGEITLVPGKQRITTVSVEPDYAALRLEGAVRNGGHVPKSLTLYGRIQDSENTHAAEVRLCVPVLPGEDGQFHTVVTVDRPRLWSDRTPNLYKCRLSLYEEDVLLDSCEETFGIRALSLDARQGLRINGIPTKLRGACIHHDNGILGAVSLYDAELRRVKLLKEAGFNAIRSAHNPASPALLRACDEVGILVMDELTDMWNEPKNAHDGALSFGRNWEKYAESMVNKDYNHPCVILYSLGNEIPEIGRLSGGVHSQRMAEAFRTLDPTRYTTFGLNGFLAVADDLHLFAGAAAQPQSSGGSEELNSMMGGTQMQMMDAFAVSPLLTNRVETAASCVDVVGYNYLTMRHAFEHTLHPDRIVVGSETFPREIPRLWPIVKENAHVIGDFTWTGLDYIGEAGIGICHYDAENKAQGWYPDRLAYCGDIDLNGMRRPVSFLREIAYGLRTAPFITVDRVDRYGKTHDENNWKYYDCIDSWTFPGYEGRPARVRVLADCEEVELFLNGVSLGRKKPDHLTAVFEVVHEPGELLAVGYTGGVAIGKHSLNTAGEVSALRVQWDRETVFADGQSLAYLTVDLVDKDGRWNRWEEKEVTVTVEGAATLQGFGSANPSGGGSYQDTTWKTWDGRVLAVIRSTQEAGNIRVRFSAPGCEDAVVSLRSVIR